MPFQFTKHAIFPLEIRVIGPCMETNLEQGQDEIFRCFRLNFGKKNVSIQLENSRRNIEFHGVNSVQPYMNKGTII